MHEAQKQQEHITSSAEGNCRCDIPGVLCKCELFCVADMSLEMNISWSILSLTRSWLCLNSKPIRMRCDKDTGAETARGDMKWDKCVKVVHTDG